MCCDGVKDGNENSEWDSGDGGDGEEIVVQL